MEAVGGEDNDRAEDGHAEEEHGELAQLALEGSADADAQEAPDDVAEREGVGFEVAVRAGLAVGAALDGADAAFLLVEGRGDGANFGEGGCGEDDAFGAAFGDG